MPENDENNHDDTFTLQDESQVQVTKRNVRSNNTFVDGIHNRHDLTFKRCMSYMEVARDFFNAFLTVQVKELIDLSTLKVHKENYVNERLHVGMVDLIFTVNYLDKSHEPGYMYLHVEHQSQYDRTMGMRVSSYQAQILSEHAKRYPTRASPLICTTIFYHGKRKKTHPIDYFNQFGNMESHARTIMNGEHTCIDVRRFPDSKLDPYPWVRAMSLMFKYADTPNFFEALREKIVFPLKYLIQNFGQSGKVFVDEIFTYLLWKGNIDKPESLIEYIHGEFSTEWEVDMASAAELLIQKGRNEGLQIGRNEGLQMGRNEGLQIGRNEGLQMGRNEGLQMGRNEGLQMGRNEGLAIGLSHGQELAAQSFAKRLLKENFDTLTISRLTNLSEEEVNLLRRS